jgi:hypothetical protein
MKSQFCRRMLFQLIAISLLSAGFVQPSGAAVISSQEFIDAEARGDRIARIETVLARKEVTDQFARFGVSPEEAQARIRNLTDEELVQLEASMGTDVVGGDALGIIGAVFLVLMILELVGITDIFKAI